MTVSPAKFTCVSLHWCLRHWPSPFALKLGLDVPLYCVRNDWMAWKNFNTASCIGERRLNNWRGTVKCITTTQIIITPFTELSSFCVGSRLCCTKLKGIGNYVLLGGKPGGGHNFLLRNLFPGHNILGNSVRGTIRHR